MVGAATGVSSQAEGDGVRVARNGGEGLRDAAGAGRAVEIKTAAGVAALPVGADQVDLPARDSPAGDVGGSGVERKVTLPRDRGAGLEAGIDQKIDAAGAACAAMRLAAAIDSFEKGS